MLALVSKPLAVMAACVLSAVLALVIWTAHYSSASSPAGFHCWNEVNQSQPLGIEKICLENQR